MITCYPMVKYLVSRGDQYQDAFLIDESLVIERARTYSQTTGVCADSPGQR